VYRGGVILHTTARIARNARRARLGVLVLFALFTAHDAVYLAQSGSGAGYAAAMSAGGHDGYYVPASLIVGIVAAVVALAAIVRLGDLSVRSASSPGSRWTTIDVGPTYLQELRSTWLRLFPTVIVLFVLQENLEAAFAGHAAPGPDVVFGATSGLVLPILAIVTFLLASLGAAVRWRTRVLLARVRDAQRHARPTGRRIPPAWASLGAAIAHDWMVDRRDAGRAPPRVAV